MKKKLPFMHALITGSKQKKNPVKPPSPENPPPKPPKPEIPPKPPGRPK